MLKQIRISFAKVVHRIISCVLALSVLVTGFIGTEIFASAEYSVPVVKLSDWSDGQQYTTNVVLEKGARYTLSFLWKATQNTPSFGLYGNAVKDDSSQFPIMIGNTAQNNADFDYLSGRATYTFIAKGTELILSVDSTSGREYCEAYFAVPKLFKVDENGDSLAEIDCHPDFVPGWKSPWGGGAFKVIKADTSIFENKMYNSLSSLSVEGYELSPTFSNTVTSYSLIVPYTQESLNVGYTLGSDGESANVSGNESLVEGNNTVKVTVTNKDGTVIVFTIRVTKQVDASKYLKAYYMGNNSEGQSISNAVVIEKGKTYTFTVLWEFVAGSTPRFSLSGDAVGANKDLVIGDAPQEGVVYDVSKGKLSYTFTALGTNLTMFAELPTTGWTEYNEIYFSKPTLFESDAAGNKTGDEVDCNAEFDPAWNHYLGANQQVKTVSKDFFDNVVVDALSKLSVEGYELSPAFANYITLYSVSVPYTVNSLEISYTLGLDGKTVEITGNENFEEGTTQTVTISVTNRDNTVTNYRIRVKKDVNPANYILAMRLSEWSDAGLEHVARVTSGKTYTFAMQWKYLKGTSPTFKLGGTVEYGSSAMYGIKTLVEADTLMSNVKYNWDTDYLSYTFTATGDYLKMTAGMGNSGVNEFRDIYFANPTLYESDAEGNPIKGGEEIDCDPEFKSSWAKWIYGGDYRHVVYVEKDFFHKVPVNALTSLDVGYEFSEPFNKDVFYYEATVPYNVTHFENISYGFAEGASLSSVSGNENFKEGGTTDVTFLINNDAGKITKYVVRAFRNIEPEAQILSLDVGYELGSTFNPNKKVYEFSVPGNVKSLDIKYTLAKNTTLVSIDGNEGFKIGIPQDVTITVKNTKNKIVVYILTVTSGGSGQSSSEEQKLLDEAAKTLTVVNTTTQKQLENMLKTALDGSGFEIAVSDFYRLKATTRVTDNYGVIIPGKSGYISAIVNLVKGEEFTRLPLMISIKSPVKEYTFAANEVSKNSDFILSDDGKILELYIGEAKKIVIPDGVEEINFAWNDALYPEKTLVLVIPDSVKILPPSLCFAMQNLEAIYMGDGVTNITERAFDQCMFLQYVSLPRGLKNIGPYAFHNTVALSSLRLPDGLERIEKNAFEFSLIREITIPASVKKIETRAFSNCFNTAYQLVIGSDNASMWYPFTSENNPDLLRLQAISDATVDYFTEDGRYFWDTLDESPVGDQTWPYGDLFCTRRTVTVLGTDTEIEEQAFYALGLWCASGNIVRIPVESISYASLDDEENSGKYIAPNHKRYLFLEDLDMSLVEAAAHLQSVAESIIVSKNASNDDIIAMLKKTYFSLKTGDLIWLEEPVKTEKNVTGILGLGNGTITFRINLNATIGELGSGKGSVSVISGSDIAMIDRKSGKLHVKDGITIAKLMKALRIDSGVTLQFYDDNGYYISDIYYDVAILEDNFVMKILNDKEVTEEFKVVAVQSNYISVFPNTGGTFPIVAGMITVLSLGGLFLIRRRKV